MAPRRNTEVGDRVSERVAFFASPMSMCVCTENGTEQQKMDDNKQNKKRELPANPKDSEVALNLRSIHRTTRKSLEGFVQTGPGTRGNRGEKT